jgi:polysaccharide biosynthesis protein PslH
MTCRPNILVLCPDIPFPVNGGGRMRMESLLRALSRSARVMVACVAPEMPAETLGWFHELGILHERYPGRKDSMASWIVERAAMLVRWTNLRYRRDEAAFFDRCFREFAPDLVWLETPYLLRYALPWRNRVPLLVDYWGTSEGAGRIFRAEAGIRKALRWLQWDIARRTEERQAREIRHIVSVSDLDGSYFRRISPHARVWSVPNGTRIPSALAAGPSREPEAPVMIFTGDLAYRPNVDAAIFFSREIFPAIRARIPTATVRYVGRNPLPEVLALSAVPGVRVDGFVPDLMDVIREATLYILPMRLGSGIRSKLFEVFPLGTPIVTTTIGAEGLELRDGVNCRIADSASTFSETCVRLLEDRQERERLGGAARDLSFSIYSQQNVERLVSEILQEIGLSVQRGDGRSRTESRACEAGVLAG